MMVKIELPESVHAYLTDKGVRAATDMLLDADPDDLPSGLDWQEVPEYYRALLGALQVRAEMVEALDRFWAAIWPEHIPSGWSEVDPLVHTESYYLPPSLETFWDERIYAHAFKRSSTKRDLYLMVKLDLTGVAIGFGLFDHDDTELVETAEGFELDENEYWWSNLVPLSGDERTVDLTLLVKGASMAAARLAELGV